MTLKTSSSHNLFASGLHSSARECIGDKTVIFRYLPELCCCTDTGEQYLRNWVELLVGGEFVKGRYADIENSLPEIYANFSYGILVNSGKLDDDPRTTDDIIRELQADIEAENTCGECNRFSPTKFEIHAGIMTCPDCSTKLYERMGERARKVFPN